MVYLGIKVLRMFTTDAEKPHCGKLRVPFMNRTTESDATSWFDLLAELGVERHGGLPWL